MKKPGHSEEQLEHALAIHISKMEKQAVDAERASVKNMSSDIAPGRKNWETV